MERRTSRTLVLDLKFHCIFNPHKGHDVYHIWTNHSPRQHQHHFWNRNPIKRFCFSPSLFLEAYHVQKTLALLSLDLFSPSSLSRELSSFQSINPPSSSRTHNRKRIPSSEGLVLPLDLHAILMLQIYLIHIIGTTPIINPVRAIVPCGPKVPNHQGKFHCIFNPHKGDRIKQTLPNAAALPTLPCMRGPNSF